MTPGLQQMALAAFWFSLMSVLVRTGAQQGLSVPQLVLARAAVTLVISLLWLRWAGVSLRGQRPALLLLRGLTGTLALACFYASLAILPLGEATIIQYTNPLLTALLAAWLLQERFESGQRLATAGCVLGLVLVARPAWLFGSDGPLIPWWALAIALTGSTMSALSYLLVRRLRTTDHPLVIVAWFPLVAFPLSIPAALGTWTPPTAAQWILMVCIGIATQLGQVHMTRALHLETAARATGMSYLQIVLAMGWGVIWFGEPIRGSSLAGGTLIVLSTLGWTGLRAHQARRDRRLRAPKPDPQPDAGPSPPGPRPSGSSADGGPPG
jgi:drug/metabolite transporter (DMT)-like permease